jgi:pimeloyl-ACP methyl ester carboxylesterase
MSNPFLAPMSPAPHLASFAKTLQLATLQISIFYFDTETDKPPMLLIHGLQDEADTWRHVFEPLSLSHRVIALDLPGFGRSDKRKRDFGVLFYVDVVTTFLDALKIDRVALVGNSLGAIICETIALTQPKRVTSVVMEAGTIKITERPKSARTNPLDLLLAKTRDKKYFEALRQDPQAAYDSLRPYYANLDAMPQADRDFLFRRVNERVWDESQRLAALAVQFSFLPFYISRAPKLAALIPSSKVPTMIIWGEQDNILPIGNGIARKALQPSAQFVSIPNTGHLPHQETPSAFLEAVLSLKD